MPNVFTISFPSWAAEILPIPLPIVLEFDSLIWDHSSFGLFSFSDGYNLVRQCFASTDWAALELFLPSNGSVNDFVSIICKLAFFSSVEKSLSGRLSFCVNGYIENTK